MLPVALEIDEHKGGAAAGTASTGAGGAYFDYSPPTTRSKSRSKSLEEAKITAELKLIKDAAKLKLTSNTNNSMDIDHTIDENLQIPFGEYLFKRLKQIENVGSIFGVPGDFNLGLLEHLYKTDLKWIGGCNELNSGYAADGYSRYTNSLGVLITTYGVGELSALNAIAGAFAEYSKVLHIVGIPKTSVINDKSNKKHLHHLVPNINSLKKSDFRVYTKMVDGISCISKTLDNPDTLTSDLDEVINAIFQTSRPGFIFLPLDMANAEVNSLPLQITEKRGIVPHIVQDDDIDKTEAIADEILEYIYQSENTAILGDILCDRFHNGTELLRSFVSSTKLPNYTTFMGKSILDETDSNFVGDYMGNLSKIGIAENLEASDLILYFGPYINEINTGLYTYNLKEEQLILLHPDYIKIGRTLYEGVHFINVLNALNLRLDTSRLPTRSTHLKYEIKNRFDNIESKSSLSQSVMLSKFENFIQEGDVIVCETGSFMFGVPDIKFKKNVRYIAQGFYLSIGMALPASTGVGIAMRDMGHDKKSRLILIEGDGSAQMTVQEISSFIQYDLKPVIFLLNNSGYTVERIIEGETRDYNDIKPWNWSKIFELFEFGDKHEKTEVKVVSDEIQLAKAFASADFNPNKLRFHEVILDPMDCPWRFHHMNGYKHLDPATAQK
ncbi:Pyruvate decarboxylase [Wickerhamomyces ciferrii]|uniref:Pyruvate decarboxylase n=1 Tax=Wickerhamomyces ciferrii (strain ATCC 14091 / BCRC 22168 / CBS 111 / JCM 3599 / NBRC 0793 / NRRL Y-1031 F-60-10) TaxID=1206466 RepID=K0KLF9_WICCF|nr:Pyruvate decarboxylase [Wickerhamomyces ciferrii]CCH43047.1 Pyruvate decarboxylase [Wickerhamomyces ciferrii]